MKQISTVGVVGAIVTGAMLSTVGATAATAATATTTSPSVTVVSTAPVAGRGSVDVRTTPMTPGQAAPASHGSSSTNGVPIGTIVNWIRNNASSIITPMKNAVRSGISAFKRWWNGLAGWIRAGVTTIANLSISELFNALWNYFFG